MYLRKEAERVDMKEKFASLEEEHTAKTDRLKAKWRELKRIREEVYT